MPLALVSPGTIDLKKGRMKQEQQEANEQARLEDRAMETDS
jgi:hypothetical protein